jgi:hypothetical protein
MAAVVDFHTVASSPAEAMAALTAYETGTPPSVPTAVDPALPRVKYPFPVAASPAERAAAGPLARVAQVPSTLWPVGRVASNPEASSAAAAPAERTGEWLVDPNEWFTSEERARRGDSNGAPVEPRSEPSSETRPEPRPEPVQPGLEPAISTPMPPTNPNATPPFAAPPQLPPTAPPTSPPAGLFPPPAAAPITPIPGPATGAPIGEPQTAIPTAPTVPPFPAPPAADPKTNIAQDGIDPHLALFAKNAYPSARDCAVCHEDIYRQWSVSAHAYAAVSPMFHKFEQKLNDLSQGTVGYFCMRCHAPVATSLGASRAEPLWNLPEVAREGVTCIACHRVQYVYGKSNGERRIEEGNIFAPVFGGLGGDGVAETIHRKEHFKVKTSPDEQGPGQGMHVAGIYFDPLTKSEFCAPCHQVAVHPGIKLEVVWEQYRASPACKKGIECQDCHMGRVPGLPLGYDLGPVAKVAGKTINDQRKRSNHEFFGPNYSIAHPGVFPFHLKASRWTMDQWLLFDWRAGWGTEDFEE